MFWIFFNTFGISVKFCVFWYLFRYKKKKRPKRLKITKNVFYKNILESDLASIKGSGFFIFFKKFKIVSPYCTVPVLALLLVCYIDLQSIVLFLFHSFSWSDCTVLVLLLVCSTYTVLSCIIVFICLQGLIWKELYGTFTFVSCRNLSFCLNSVSMLTL